MNELLFFKSLANETNLRILYGIWRKGQGTKYRIENITRLDRRVVKRSLSDLVAVGLVEPRMVTRVPTFGGRHRDVTEYALNPAHETVPALSHLFSEVELQEIVQ